MNKRKLLMAIAASLVMLLSEAAVAGGLDGSRPIFGTVDRLIEINRQRIIDNVDPDTVGLPKAFIIDLKSLTMRGQRTAWSDGWFTSNASITSKTS